MANDLRSPGAANEPVSLYRRYRPGTFEALRGQDHVVRALRSAVAHDQVAHAYLFSGPRGTGKTSTARILAKALNCEHVVEGEPCGTCASCVEITRGTSMDVIEMDAASNNGVDAIRDLISHAALGSPGRSKVYIVDEVHMLTPAAANALLKTLEEPPGHVVFVLATTDPQKVPATIRSRTQHLEFRLLSADTLEQLVKDVSDDAGLGLDEAALSVAVRKGRGSARDALSALDQVAASGDATDIRPALIEVIEGLCEEDAGRSLVALSALHESGWGPQQLCVELVDDLRQGFLLTLSPTVADMAGTDRSRIEDQARRLGLGRLVRAIELLGRSQVDMRDAPDPQVILEVAVVRAARSDLDGDVASLDARLAKLERAVAQLSAGGAAPARAATPPPPPPTPVAPADGSKPSLGAYRAAKAAAAPSAPAPAPAPAPAAATPPPAAPEPAPAPTTVVGEPEAAPTTPTPPTDVSLDSLSALWTDTILGELKGITKAMYSAGRLTSLEGNVARFAVPTDPHRDKCVEKKAQVEGVLSTALGVPITLEIVVDGSATPSPPPVVEATAPAPVSESELEEEASSIDLTELVEAPQGAVANVATSRILEAFPGAVEEEA